MDWHARYIQQAAWTKDLRKYILEKAGLSRAKRILEVGCGSGAILRELPRRPAARVGLDLDFSMLCQSKTHAAGVSLLHADGHHLPFANQSFEIAYCHYLLLWVKHPLRVVKEMARVSRCVIAFAEPDYSKRMDKPHELKQLGELQNQSLALQGADIAFGSMLAETFFQAGIKIEETGAIQPEEKPRLSGGENSEWDVMEADLRRVVSGGEIQKMKELDEQARQNGTRVLHVPTFFAWGWSDV